MMIFFNYWIQQFPISINEVSIYWLIGIQNTGFVTDPCHHSTQVGGVCTCSKILRCEGSSQRFCGTRSLASPSAARCQSWGTGSSAPRRKARRWGSTSARPRCQGGSACGTAASCLQELLGWGRRGVRASPCRRREEEEGAVRSRRPVNTNLVGSNQTCRSHCLRAACDRWLGSVWCCHWGWWGASTWGWSGRMSWRRRWGPEGRRVLRKTRGEEASVTAATFGNFQTNCYEKQSAPAHINETYMST